MGRRSTDGTRRTLEYHAGGSRLVKVTVDGVETMRLDLDRQRSVRLAVGPEAERIEILACDGEGEIPLASLFLPYDPSSGETRACEASTVLEGGQRIVFRVSPKPVRAGEDPGSDVAVCWEP